MSRQDASNAAQQVGGARRHRMPFGAELQEDGRVRFRLWAPACPDVSIRIRISGRNDDYVVKMVALGDGWHEWFDGNAGVATLYQFVLPDGAHVPDPASRFQPSDVHGPSEVVDPADFAWSDSTWKGRSWTEAVLYELHVGTFTPQGTFRAAVERLDHLVSLGVNAIELMPVADFPGRRNWGYDGVLWFAPDATYGRPNDFKALIDAAHSRGIMVVLDVVYNHFGPDGNHLPKYAPDFFSDQHKTPWGAAVNFDGTQSTVAREFVIENALYWIHEYNLDGLRLDAVHAIADDSHRHLLEELADRLRASVSRPLYLLLENDDNAVRWLSLDATGASRRYSAQWNDDVHHVLHVAATGESQGYYADYVGQTAKLGRALAEGFAFQGELMNFSGRSRGEPSVSLPPTAFVAFIQNHDQVGNRALGERISQVAEPDAVRAIAATYLLLPQIPMLFMGEEWGCKQPFPFFCHFESELAAAVKRGRQNEFALFADCPDPQSESTFDSARLEWRDTEQPEHAAWLDFYRRVLSVRRSRVVPLLERLTRGGVFKVLGTGAVEVSWRVDFGPVLTLEANISPAVVAGFAPSRDEILWVEGKVNGGEFSPWSIRWSLTDTSPP